MTPANPDALAEALAQYYWEEHAYLRSTAAEKARTLVAGPLAPFSAELQRVTAERDEAREVVARCNNSFGSYSYHLNPHPAEQIEKVKWQARSEWQRAEAAEVRAAQLQAEVAEAQDIAKQLQGSALDAEHWQGEAARLQAEVEAKDRALDAFASMLSDREEMAHDALQVGGLVPLDPEFEVEVPLSLLYAARTAREG